MMTFLEWLLVEERELVPASVLQTYERAFKQALERLLQRTQNPVLRQKFTAMLKCPIVDSRGHCRSFTDYIIGALVRNGIHKTNDVEATLGYIAEKVLMDRSLDTRKPRATVFDGFDESRPFGPDENPLQARFISYLRWAINNIRKGKIKRLANVERRPEGVVSITPGRHRQGEPVQGYPPTSLPTAPLRNRPSEN
jgi:hypothetical protein